MSEEAKSQIDQWRTRIGAGRKFHEQDLWRTRTARGAHTDVGYCGMDRRMAIKRVLIDGLRARVVEAAGPGMWCIP